MAIAIVSFNIALFPSLLSKDKPALKTSLLTGTMSLVLGFSEMTLGLWLAAIATIVNGCLWLILAYQKKRST